ncbi:MAG: hypothetical protein G01um101429_735 [Parcubacteria group bacterium Gr01-1014_29]|nr:MAG: hypothetical protein G01um101429_735 [Parcubacteria group bacterium Gr01-1014_29]
MEKSHKQIVLRFRAVNKDIFNMIRLGKKRVETRAATMKYRNISPGDSIIFVCGTKRFTKTVAKASRFKSIRAMLRVYDMKDIMPSLNSEKELREAYYSYQNYKEKIKKFGIITLEFER